jgi:hypothetical protein
MLTLLGAVYDVQRMKTFGVPDDDMNQLVWGRIVPGFGVTVLVGNVYDTWQASRLTNMWGRPYTAQAVRIEHPSRLRLCLEHHISGQLS